MAIISGGGKRWFFKLFRSRSDGRNRYSLPVDILPRASTPPFYDGNGNRGDSIVAPAVA